MEAEILYPVQHSVDTSPWSLTLCWDTSAVSVKAVLCLSLLSQATAPCCSSHTSPQPAVPQTCFLLAEHDQAGPANILCVTPLQGAWITPERLSSSSNSPLAAAPTPQSEQHSRARSHLLLTKDPWICFAGSLGKGNSLR